jgi:hypothetical protein
VKFHDGAIKEKGPQRFFCEKKMGVKLPYFKGKRKVKIIKFRS